jgi:rSAM/selenodomain-associated transferase 1
MKPPLRLELIALASLAIYVLAFVLPYNLFAWWQMPYLTIAKITDFDNHAGALYVVSFASLFALYWLGSRLVARAPSRRLWVVTLAGAAAINLALVFLYPVDAADIFDNILRGRMQVFYGANPYYVRPSSDALVGADPFYEYAAWQDFPSAYAAGWEIIASTVAHLPGDGVISNVIAFKLVDLLAYAATAALIARALQRTAPERALYGVWLFAWNPLVLYATAGNGHNDIVMLLFAVLGFYWLGRKHFTLAAMAETAGAVVKFIPALFFPIVIIAALSQLATWQSRARYLALTGAACAAMVALAYAPYWRGIDVFGADWRSLLYTSSLPTLAQMALEPALGAELASTLVSRAALLLVLAWLARQCRILWRDASGDAPVRAALAVLIFYLLVSVLWFEAWYAVWLIPLAALLPDQSLTRGSFLVSLAATWKMPIFDFALMVRPPDRILPVPIREWGVTLGTLALPWFYFAYQSLRTKERPDMKRALLVVCKKPAPGQTKTRLAPPLSPEHAAELYECFLRDSLEVARAVPGVTRILVYLPQDQGDYFDRLAPDFERIPQEGATLGERLDHALTRCLSGGFDQAVIMDSDSPTLPSSYVSRAFDELGNVDVVVGPCEDGGYYLIGMTRPQPHLLREVAMSTPNVTRNTLALAAEESLRVALLPTWYDIDTVRDWERLVEELCGATNGIAPHTRAFVEMTCESPLLFPR